MNPENWISNVIRIFVGFVFGAIVGPVVSLPMLFLQGWLMQFCYVGMLVSAGEIYIKMYPNHCIRFLDNYFGYVSASVGAVVSMVVFVGFYNLS